MDILQPQTHLLVSVLHMYSMHSESPNGGGDPHHIVYIVPYAAMPISRRRATRYSWGRSPLTRLQWAQRSCRFSM